MKRVGQFVTSYGPFVALAALFLASAIWQPDYFLQPENLMNLLRQSAAAGIVAVGMTLVIAVAGIDLSVGSMLALAAALGLLALNKVTASGGSEGTAVLVAALVGMGVGTVLGTVNGFLVVVGRIPPFIATLGGLVAYRSLSLALAEGGEIRSSSRDVFPEVENGGVVVPFLQAANGRELVLNWSVLTFLTLAVLAAFLLARTRYGRHVIATGANERAARYSAIPTGRVRLVAYVILGLLTGIASVFAASRLNSVSSSQMGTLWELDAIAAVTIGGTSLAGGRGKIWGTVAGVLILAMISNILSLSDVSPYWQGFVKGVIILLAVLIQRGRAER